ncbi:hypothetical protein FH584_06855 [Leptospira interrogans]|uniref:hypothetical protein n=1 Tax=Leptospira interrogans TaxID=173 RepID=UPI001EEFEB3A|nr:hypothetical protein [Leptospira interrogans]ULG93602.1 hypothetical protein FH584_06855 [Leptospira interrogans]
MFEKSRSILIQVILIFFVFLYSAPIQTQDSTPYALDAPCREFGNYPTLEEIKKAKLKNDPTKILVKTVKGNPIEVPTTDAYDAVKISDEKGFHSFMKTYESICGKGIKPPFYYSIPFIVELETQKCVGESKRFKKSSILKSEFWRSKAEQLSISICYNTRNAILNNPLALPEPLDSKCPDFGILSIKKEDLNQFKLNSDSGKIWVRTANGKFLAIRNDQATEAFKISNDDELFHHYVNFAMVCGERVPPHFDVIPYLETESAEGCIRHADKSNPRAEAECYEKANDSFLGDKFKKKK